MKKGSAIAKKAHTFGAWVVTKKPTCISEGTETRTCSAPGCGETEQRTVATVAHDDQYHDAQDNTMHHHTCSTCIMSENESHVPDGEGVFYAATCEERAYRLFTCKLCKGDYKVYDETSKALGHEWGEWTVKDKATCQHGGEKIRYCEREGCEASGTVNTPKNEGHNWVLDEEATEPATCEKAGVKVYVCADCGESKDPETIPATGAHSWEPVDGETNKEKCSVCKITRVVISAAEPVKSNALPDNENVSVKNDNNGVDILLPTEVISQVKNESGDVTVSAGEVENKQEVLDNASNLSDEQKDALKKAPLYDFGLTVGDKPLGAFDAKVTVTLPYTLQEGEDPDGIIIWYVAEDGNVEEINAHYDAETKNVTFQVEHFSYYAVAYRETQEMRCRRGLHDYKFVETVAATCKEFGYTVKKCSCCGAVDFADIQEKKTHDYGNIVIGTPTCTEGAWDTRTCSKCGDVLNVTYRGALGHKPESVATCTSASVCKVCGQTVSSAKGHEWDEWKTVVEPTEITVGLKRRYCLRCGECEEVKLAASGNIETLKFDSYQELFELIFNKVLRLDDGTLKFDYVDPEGMKVSCQVTVNREGNSYLILAEGTYTSYGQENDFSALYRNGLLIAAYKDGERMSVIESDSELFSPIPIDVLKNYMEQYFDLINPMVEGYMGQAREVLKSMTEQYGALVNKLLLKAGCTYKAEELSSVLDSVETVYTYLALKLGYQTNLNILDGVKLPTHEDLLRAAEALMTVTEKDGLTTYELTGEPLMNAINTVLDWYDAHSEKVLSELIYEVLGEDLKAWMPELTDFAACEAAIREQFTGATTVKVVVDRLISLLESNEICTLDELYALIDSVVTAQTGKDFSCKDFIEQNGAMTLDKAVQTIFGSQEVTLDALYETVFKYLKETKLADVTVPLDEEKQATVAQLAEVAKQYLAQMELNLLLTFTVDAEGNLVSLDLSEKLAMLPPKGDADSGSASDDESGETILSLIQLGVKRDSTVKVIIPDVLKPITDHNVTASYDKDGNLIIKGLDSEFEYSFRIQGDKDIPLEELLTKDEQMTAKMGFPVYIMPERYADYSQDDWYLFKDGKYYEYDREWERKALYTVPLSEFLKAPQDHLAVDSAYVGKAVLDTEDGEQYVDVYESVFGRVFLLPGDDNKWCRILRNGSRYTSDGNGNSVWMIWIEEYRSIAPYLEEGAMQLGFVESSWGTLIVDGKEKAMLRLNLSAGEDMERLDPVGYLDGDKLFLALTTDYTYYELGEETEVPASGQWRVDEKQPEVRDEKGNILTGYTYGYYHYQLPRYYALVDAGTKEYVELPSNAVSTSVIVKGLPTRQLPNGKTLYVILDDLSSPYLFGYTEFEPGAYVQTACTVEGNEIREVFYRNAVTAKWVSFNNLFDLNTFMTKNADGSYTIRAELLNKLKELCTEPGDRYCIQVQGSKDTTAAYYEAYYEVGTYVVPEKMTLSSSRPSYPDQNRIDWSLAFDQFGDKDAFKVTKNSDGSINIFFRDGSKLGDIYYSFRNRFSADSILKKDEEKSEETGLDIWYKEKTERNWYDRVLRDGKYYRYATYDSYRASTTSTLADQIASVRKGWKLEQLTYRYDFTFTAEDGTEKVLPVYRAEFCNNAENIFDKYRSIVLYCIYDNECLQVLIEAEEKGESELKFEGMVPASEYFAGLEYVWNSEDDYDWGTVRINGKIVSIRGTTVTFYYSKDKNGNMVDSFRVSLGYYDVGGKTYWMSDGVYEGQWLELRDEETDLDGYLPTERFNREFVNGSYTFCNLVRETIKKIRYIKLDGQFYHYDSGYYDSYENRKIDEEQFADEWMEREWCYKVEMDGYTVLYRKFEYNEDGSVNPFDVWCYEVRSEDGVRFYGTMEPDDDGKPIFSDEMTVDLAGVVGENEFGVTEDGRIVYEVVCRMQPENAESITLRDGNVFYHIDGTGYLKTTEGYYVHARRITMEDGSERILCDEWLSKLEPLSDDEARRLGVLDEYLTLNEDGNILTISKDILNVIGDYKDEFSLNISWRSISYWELETWLMQELA
ncbi:MAG TPA: hypothetical protein DDW30_06885 [Clostridiales bacterium]|nr:hypothetical protein [Clostridiales bacterium]